MQLKIIGSNSAGNSYILENEYEALLIECGMPFKEIKRALNFNLSKVVGCIITHNHLDHCKAVKDVMAAGIDIFSTFGTLNAMGVSLQHRANAILPGQSFIIGDFKILPFSVKHDCSDPVGYLIHHKETGNVLFLTDSYYCEYTFKGLNNIIIEANYCQTILDKRVADGDNPLFLRDRVITSHMSLATCKDTLKANNLADVNNIILIHLSDGNSDAKRFKREVQEATGKIVHVAEPGMTIEFNNKPF